MGGIQKNLKYKAARSTRLLNNHIKDNYGQQRSVVLFGFNVSPAAPNSNNIIVGPGAAYTQDGQKIFAYDDVAANLTIDTGSIESQVEMYTVVLRHSYVADTSTNEPAFEIFKVKDWLPRNVEPIKDIRKQNIINGFISQDSPTLRHSTFNSVEGFNVGEFNNINYSDGDAILGYNQTVLTKIIINWDLVSGSIIDSNTLFKTGVAVYSYRNPWEQIRDQLGIDFFEPAQSDSSGNTTNYLERWNDGTVAISTNDPFIGVNIIDTNGNVVNHSHLQYGRYATTQENRTPTNAPLYGYFSNVDNFARYKFASFLDDGHSIKWNLQRLSETVRAIESRVGSHPSKSAAKTYQASSPKTIAQDVTTNRVSGVYDSRGNFILKNGGLGWFKPSVGDGYSPTDDYQGLGTVTLADNHHTALTLIDRTLGYMYRNRLGLSGITNGADLSRNDIFNYNQNLPSTSFDREDWNYTSLSGDPGQGATLKEYTQHLIDYKLHRDYGSVYSWLNFGTDQSQERIDAASFQNYYTVNGIEYWFNVDDATDMSQIAVRNPLHIGRKGIITHRVVDDRNNQLWGNFYQFGTQISPWEELVSHGVGVLYPETINVTTPLRQPGDPTQFQYIEVYGKNYNRSTIVGGQALNFATRRYSDLELTIDTNGVDLRPDNDSTCTISWTINQANYSDKITAKVTDSRTPIGDDTRINVRLFGQINYYDKWTLLEPYFPSLNRFAQSQYLTPWNAIAYSNMFLNTTEAGLATLSFTKGVGTYNVALVYNKYESGLPYNTYDDNINIVDPFTSESLFKFEGRRGGLFPTHTSHLPLQVKDWVVLSNEDNVAKVYTKIKPQSNKIIGLDIGMAGDTVSISADSVLNLSAKKIVIGAGSELIISEGAVLSVDGRISVEEGGVINTRSGGKITISNGGQTEVFEGGEIRFHKGSSISINTPDSGGSSLFWDYVNTYSINEIIDSNKFYSLWSGNSNIANIDQLNPSSGTDFDDSKWAPIYNYKINSVYEFVWYYKLPHDPDYKVEWFLSGTAPTGSGWVRGGGQRLYSRTASQTGDWLSAAITYPDDTASYDVTITEIEVISNNCRLYTYDQNGAAEYQNIVSEPSTSFKFRFYPNWNETATTKFWEGTAVFTNVGNTIFKASLIMNVADDTNSLLASLKGRTLTPKLTIQKNDSLPWTEIDFSASDIIVKYTKEQV